MSNLMLRRSLGAGVFTLAVGIGTLIFGAVMLPGSDICGLGFVMLASFALIATGAYMLIDRRAQMSITDCGLWVRSIGGSEIPWERITSAKMKWLPRSGNFISITLDTGVTYTFFAEGFQVSSDDLLKMINERIEPTGNTKPDAND